MDRAGEARADPETAGRGTASARLVLVVLLTAAAYAAAGWLALGLPLGGGWASPLYPSAGIALAATLVFGWRGALGSAIGAFAVNLAHAHAVGATPTPIAYGIALAVGVGAAIQALLGRAALVRSVGLPLTLRTPAQIARFSIWGGIVPCLFNATWSNAVLRMVGAVPAEVLVQSWWTWWLGDTLGLLVAAPIALSVIGQPREDWAPRRLSVGLPMLVGMALLIMATITFHRWERERLQETFGHSADAAMIAIDEQLDESIYALHAIHGMLAAHDEPRRVPLRPVADWWFEHSRGLRALGYSERVPRGEIAAFEADARAGGLAGYRVFDRADSAGLAAEDPYVVAIRAITPHERNAAALGVNAMSVAAAREALLAAARGGDDASTQGFTLTQAERAQENGVVVYRALYRGQPVTAEDRLAQWRGVVFVTLEIEHALDTVMRRMRGPLHWCLTEPAAPGGAVRRLGGPEGCENGGAADFSTARALAFADRQWTLRLWADAKDLPGGLRTGGWLFSVIGVVATSVLGALLLTITGRARRIELAVQERTQALSTEVRERRAAEAALRDSEQRLRGIVDHVPIGVAFMDRRGRLLDTNPSLCRMLGRSDAELRGLRFRDLGERDEVASDLAAARRLVDGRATVVSRQTRLRRTDGSPLPVRYSLTALHDTEGRATRLVGVVEDISEHLRLAATERARDAAEAASRAKSEFVSRMSHELRTPLNAMLGFGQLLGLDRKPPLAPHQAQWATQIQHAGWHLLELINDTLDMSRIESGLIQLDAQSLDIEPMVRACMSLLEGPARRRGVRVHVALDRKAAAVNADETRFKQVLTNLLSNAVKYNRDGGEVFVVSRPAGSGMVEIDVRDTGIGMSARQLAELFQPYNRLGRERTGIEGTGIGLVICRRLAELMGGALGVRSTEGEGSVFTLRLPCAPAAAEAGTPPSQTGSGPAQEADYASRRVHYVEDNPTNIEVVRGILARRPQIMLEASTSGRDGLEAMRRHRPDLVLLDMHLPDIDGLDLLRALKRDDELADIPVLVLSADASRGRIEDALTLGAVKYLTKPLDARVLVAAVDEVLAELVTRWG